MRHGRFSFRSLLAPTTFRYPRGVNMDYSQPAYIVDRLSRSIWISYF